MRYHLNDRAHFIGQCVRLRDEKSALAAKAWAESNWGEWSLNARLAAVYQDMIDMTVSKMRHKINRKEVK